MNTMTKEANNMQLTKCDWCKKIIKGNVYCLAMYNTSTVIANKVYFDICEDCYKELHKKLSNKEENEDGDT